jgi:hypothetical protein
MGFVHPHKPDIFVSYARVNDIPPEGCEVGWVTTLVKSLKTLLAEKLGRADSFELWMDHELPGHVPLTPEIEARVRDAAILLIILSDGYLASEWCRKEMTLFHQEIRRETRWNSSVFVVEYDQVERPPELADLAGYRLWVEDRIGKAPRPLGFPRPMPEERRYFDLLNDLRHEIAAELKRLKAAAEARGPSAPEAEHRDAVFLAEATDDVDELRDEVKRYLQQQGLRIVPEIPYPREAAAFRRATEADLRAVTLFVQLLGALPGKRLPGSDQGVVGLQHASAVGLGVPIVQWHARQLVASQVTSPGHRTLLEGPAVMVSDLEEFKAEVVRRIETQRAQTSPDTKVTADGDTLVFINAEDPDLDHARRIGKILFQQGIAYVLPERGDAPSKVRDALEQYLVDCDALMLFHGTNPAWVVRQWDLLRKLKPRRKSPLRIIGLCDGPPPEKGDCTFEFPGFQVIDCRRGLSDEAFRSFITSLCQGSGP